MNGRFCFLQILYCKVFFIVIKLVVISQEGN